MKAITIFMCVTALTVFCLVETAEADEVVLKNGSSITGQVQEETEDSVTLRIELGTMTIPKSEIAQLVRDAFAVSADPAPEVAAPPISRQESKVQVAKVTSGLASPPPAAAQPKARLSKDKTPAKMPHYDQVASAISKTAREHGVEHTPEDLRREIEMLWTAYTKGMYAPLSGWKDQVRIFRLKNGTKMEFVSDNKDEYKGNYKFQRSGKWVYQYTLPQPAKDNATVCWKKYAYRARVGTNYSGDTVTEIYFGSNKGMVSAALGSTVTTLVLAEQVGS